MPHFQQGDKAKQRHSSERMSLACCWDRRRAIALLTDIAGSDPTPPAAGKWVSSEVMAKVHEFLDDVNG